MQTAEVIKTGNKRDRQDNKLKKNVHRPQSVKLVRPSSTQTW